MRSAFSSASSCSSPPAVSCWGSTRGIDGLSAAPSALRHHVHPPRRRPRPPPPRLPGQGRRGALGGERLRPPRLPREPPAVVLVGPERRRLPVRREGGLDPLDRRPVLLRGGRGRRAPRPAHD